MGLERKKNLGLEWREDEVVLVEVTDMAATLNCCSFSPSRLYMLSDLGFYFFYSLFIIIIVKSEIVNSDWVEF